MITFQVTVVIFLAAILGTAVARKFHWPLELTLLAASLIVALIPGVPAIQLGSEIIFYVFLPPILFAAAYFTSWSEFKRNIRPISFLAFGLVVFTVCGMALATKWLIPSFTWPMAFLLGAIVSPPDASAAATVTRKVGFPRRLQTILEGESLLNDATALVCYRFAAAALVTREFHLGHSIAQFFVVAVGGVVVGLGVTYVAMQLLIRIKDASAETLLTLVAAFVCYFASESLHFSGVIATVAGGLYAGRTLPRWATAETRVEAKAVWEVVLLAVNALVFALIGLQLPVLLVELGDVSFLQLFGWALVLTFAVVAIRFLWVIVVAWLPRALVPGVARRYPMPSVATVVVIGWTGMRGIVSVAAALALPTTLEGGEPFVERPLIIFLAYAIVLLTLVIPTLTLPGLLRWLALDDSDANHNDEVQARISMAKAAADYLSTQRTQTTYDAGLLADLKARYRRQYERLSPNLDSHASSLLDPAEQQRRILFLELFELERGVLHELRSSGDLHDEVYHHLGEELDLEVLRVRRNMRPL
jgi:monovalent cation/hydrogen antiporter